MSAYESSGKYIICPFYCGITDGRLIHCEGPVNFSRSMIKFEKTDELAAFLSTTCCGRPERCPIYHGMMKVKYSALTPPSSVIP